MRSTEQRTLDAEVRGVEEGHHVFVNADGTYKVVSEVTGEALTVSAVFDRGVPVFSCDHEVVRRLGAQLPSVSEVPGACPCKHAALVARRLEREGLIVNVDGLWSPTERGLEVDEERRSASVPADPFAGL